MDTNHNTAYNNNDYHNNILGGKNDNKQKFIGQGAYGCTWSPGLSCKGKTSRATSYINKIQKVDFYSQNEVEIGKLIKQIPLYKNMFAPVSKYCTLKFNQIINSNLDIDKCDKFIEYKDELYINFSDEKKMLNKNFLMFYIKFIKGGTFDHFLLDINNLLFYSNYFISFFYLINSIKILNDNHISHNDLHYHNIMYDKKKNRPIIIDFGFSFHINNLYKNKNNNSFNYHNIRKYILDYRIDTENSNNFHYLIEKRFISFCVFNNTSIFKNKVDSDDQINNLNKRALDFFINDTYHSIINHQQILYIFNDDELIQYKNALQKFYSKFLDKNKYKYYSDIIRELLPLITQFSDTYSISSTFIQLYFKNYYHKNIHKSEYIFIFSILKHFFKKNLYPDPITRITSCQFISIIVFIVSYFNNIDLKNDTHHNYFNIFYQKIKILFSEIGVDYKIFFNKKYAFIDFQRYFSPDNIKLFQELNINLPTPI
jgi:hypothetical protein